jgi:plasmid maintenance system antidote protein VapI
VSNGTAAFTADTALRLGRLTCGAPELYLGMQIDHDPQAAQHRLKDELAQMSASSSPTWRGRPDETEDHT